MGTWGEAPWDNDNAADWLDHFMAQTNIRGILMETIQQEFDEQEYPDFPQGGTYDQLDQIRAAISLFIMLGRIYVWPLDIEDEGDTDSFTKDLKIVLDRAREITAICKQEERFFPVMDREVAILERRLERPEKLASLEQESEWPWGMDC